MSQILLVGCEKEKALGEIGEFFKPFLARGITLDFAGTAKGFVDRLGSRNFNGVAYDIEFYDEKGRFDQREMLQMCEDFRNIRVTRYILARNTVADRMEAVCKIYGLTLIPYGK